MSKCRGPYADLRPPEFSTWDSTLTATEAWLALHRGDLAAAEQLIARAFDVARLYATGIGSRLSDLSGVVGRISHALELESKRGVDTATRERFEAIRAWVVSELEKDIAEAERTVPESPSVLSAKRARAKLLGDTEGANEYDDKIFGAPNTTYQQAAIGPPWTKRE